MKLALATPVVINLPGAHASWERTGTIEDIARIAEAADRLGYDHMTCSEHIGIPAAEAERRGARYWDPLATFGFLAARTRRIRFATYVLVLGYNHPLEIVKRYGTLDQVSGGRVVLGVGVGTLQEEFELLGVSMQDRGPRADDALRALRQSLGSNQPSYAGTHYSYGGLVVDPCAAQEHLPLWVGGRTYRSLRRAVELADGWCPFNVSVATAGQWLRRAEPPADFETVLQPDDALDPIGDPRRTLDTVAAMADAGISTTLARFVHHSIEHYLEQVEALVGVTAELGTR